MKNIKELIKKLDNEAIIELTIKEYKRKDKKYKLLLNKTVSYVDNLNFYYISLIDNEANIYLFDKKINYDTLNNIYSIYSIYDNYSGFVKSNYIKNVIDFLEIYNKNVRKSN